MHANATAIASIFGLEDWITEKLGGFAGRISALAAMAEGKTTMVGLSGGCNILGNDGCCSIIGVEVGFDHLGDGDVTSTHGNESSFELIVDLKPDIFLSGP